MAVIYGDGVALNEVLACGKEIERTVSDGKVPADRTRLTAGAVLRDRAEREGAEIAVAVRRHGGGVGVGEIQIGKVDRARGGVRCRTSGRIGELGDLCIRGRRNDDRR